MISNLLSSFIDLLFPRRCPVCHDIVMPKGNLICPACLLKLHFVKSPVCQKCGKEIVSGQAEYCLDCARHRRSFEYGKALISYTDTARDSMVKIKYKNKREYLDFYIEALALRYGTVIQNMKADALIPVPVHPSRLRSRGYNQAEVLAKGLGERLGIPVNQTLLLRGKKTAPQKTLAPSERLRNLEQAFQASPVPPGIQSVILVDDIYTTGSTIEACTRILKKAGIKKVYFITICIGGER